MIDDRDDHPAPYVDGFGSASTLSPLSPHPKFRKMRRIGFRIPKPPKEKR